MSPALSCSVDALDGLAVVLAAAAETGAVEETVAIETAPATDVGTRVEAVAAATTSDVLATEVVFPPTATVPVTEANPSVVHKVTKVL
jgi:hypothetical protein